MACTVTVRIGTLRQLLDAAGVRNPAVAKAVGIHPAYLSHRISKGGLFRDQLETLATYLSTSPDSRLESVVTCDALIELIGGQNVRVRGTL
jgi:hypothetical protein